MGSLGAPFILCPLSDRKELLGMAEDKAKHKLIITIGKNIAIRYHVLEQKQEASWTMSRHWLTSHVIFCPDVDKYGAVLDNNTVALWEEEDTALDNITKIKFSEPLYRLMPTNRMGTLLLFENGFHLPLQSALGMKDKGARKRVAKEGGLIDPNTQMVVEAAFCEATGHLVLLTADKKSGRHVQKREQIMAHVIKGEEGVICELKVEAEMIGHCIQFLEDSPPSFLYLCEDGRLLEQSLSASAGAPLFVGSLGKCVSVKTPVVLRATEESSTLVVYGSDPSEEGAVVLLYDTKYDLVVAKQGLKMYGTPPLMERVGANVFIPVGLHVLVVGLRASKSLLSGVIGAHGIHESGEEVFEQRAPFFKNPASTWQLDGGQGEERKKKKKKGKGGGEREELDAKEFAAIKKSFPLFYPDWKIVAQSKTLEREGQPQSLICSQIVPLLLALKGKEGKEEGLSWLLQTYSDIPELHLMSILAHILPNLPPPTTEHIYDENALLELVLRVKVDCAQLERSLSALPFPSCLTLVEYLKCRMDKILDALSQEGWNLMEKSVGWMLVLLDAHFPRFVMCSEGEELVGRVLLSVERGMKWMEEIKELEPYLLFARSKVDHRPRPNPKSKWRSEILTFY